jgi:hypothetical protein
MGEQQLREPEDFAGRLDAAPHQVQHYQYDPFQQQRHLS